MSVKRTGWLKSETALKIQLVETKNGKSSQLAPIVSKLLPNQESSTIKIYDCPNTIQPNPSTTIQVHIFVDGPFYPLIKNPDHEITIFHKQPEIIGFTQQKNRVKRSSSYIDVPMKNPRNYSILVNLGLGRTGTLKTNKDFIRIPIDTNIPKDDSIKLHLYFEVIKTR